MPEELAVIVADKNPASAFAGVVRRAEAANSGGLTLLRAAIEQARNGR
jgi:hypothetical protein